ncbi:hypothetical protein MAPG_10562 [Magnaporthiopsis poae ATCC 64411]|uniref:HNH nuclease domain-containing protein n=1 Tax=Magnaporthiopsis poae (strain ATCC 64411 / 73-15) TaxID=644358 RepID=A0A0C4ECX3_MAGP6|nr:hypothetical protein MAPG_10562 [Magnaporthiopsis poae ATCC 64411]
MRPISLPHPPELPPLALSTRQPAATVAATVAAATHARTAHQSLIRQGPAAVKGRDLTRRSSGCTGGTETAHLVPAWEKIWFSANNMSGYCPPSALDINDERNMLLLRKDIHHLFDTKFFVFVPKRLPPVAPNRITLPTTTLPTDAQDANTLTTTTVPTDVHTDLDAQAILATYVLLPEVSPELAGLYHNRLRQPLCGLGVEFFFARFAWALFSDTHMPFFRTDFEVAVRLLDKTTDAFETRHMRAGATPKHTPGYSTGHKAKVPVQGKGPCRPTRAAVGTKKTMFGTRRGSHREDGH